MATEDLVAFRQAIAELRTMPTEIRRKLRPALKAAAQPIVTEAKAKADWSTRIPRAIKVRVTKKGVVIYVRAKTAPHGRPYEGLSGMTFRHPVFGDRDVWRAQRARPYLLPAVRAHRDQVRKAITDVVEQVAKEHGFR